MSTLRCIVDCRLALENFLEWYFPFFLIRLLGIIMMLSVVCSPLYTSCSRKRGCHATLFVERHIKETVTSSMVYSYEWIKFKSRFAVHCVWLYAVLNQDHKCDIWQPFFSFCENKSKSFWTDMQQLWNALAQIEGAQSKIAASLERTAKACLIVSRRK